MKKKLLIFAHRGEARSFLSHFTPKADSNMEGLYECEDHFLLITGEGPWKAGPKLGLVLGQWGEQISEIVNFGIAGALRPEVELNSIHEIRTVFLEQNQEMQFISHQLANDGIDLITCHSRVLNQSMGEKLDNFAPTVDRELWSLAQVASFSGHKISAYKLISDKVGDEEICQRVKEKSDEFSSRLLDFYQGLKWSAENSSSSYEWDGFYFTTSLKNQREKLLHSLTIKYGEASKAIEALNLSDILEQEEVPKKRSGLLIQRMKDLLNPAQKEVINSLEELTLNLRKAGAQIKFPKDFERSQFHLSAHIESPSELVSLIKAMEEFDYEKLVHIIEGKDLHV